jgi:orotidine-5'-phosphate decarboxylase
MTDKIIVAFDCRNQNEFDQLFKELKDTISYAKIGMESFYRFGPEIIKRFKQENIKVFLDLKIHDIPHTLYQTAKTLMNLGVDMINIHALAGLEGLQAIVKAKKDFLAENTHASAPLLIGVTVLTSMDTDQLSKLNIAENDPSQYALHLASLCQEAGLDGVVCSAWEVQKIKEATSKSFLCVTPGIRLTVNTHDDQKRVMTPVQALKEGSDFLVIGRPITQSDHPQKTFIKIEKEIS